MIQTPVADVVSPAIAAHDPDVAADENISHRFEVAGLGRNDLLQALAQLCHVLPLSGVVGLILLFRVEQRIGQLSTDFVAHSVHQLAGVLLLLVQRQAEAVTELSVVLKETVGPGRSPPVGVLRPRGGGQIAAVDGGAARRIGNNGAVAVELAH